MRDCFRNTQTHDTAFSYVYKTGFTIISAIASQSMTLRIILTKDQIDLKWYDIVEYTTVQYWSSILPVLMQQKVQIKHKDTTVKLSTMVKKLWSKSLHKLSGPGAPPGARPHSSSLGHPQSSPPTPAFQDESAEPNSSSS